MSLALSCKLVEVLVVICADLLQGGRTFAYPAIGRFPLSVVL